MMKSGLAAGAFVFAFARLLCGADVLSVWNGGAGNWSAASNWTQFPGAFPPDYPHDGISTYDVLLTNGQANLTEAVTVERMGLSNAILSGTFQFTANDRVTWSGGTINGGVLFTATGGVDFASAETKSLDNAALTMSSASSWSGPGSIYLISATITNTGVFEIQNDSNLQGGEGSFPTPLFRNMGTVRKTGGTGSTIVTNCAFDNVGLVQVESGTLILGGPGTSSGSFHVAAGAALEFAGKVGNSAPILETGAILQGAGIFRGYKSDVIIAGLVTNYGNFELSVGGMGSSQGAFFNMSNGIFRVTSTAVGLYVGAFQNYGLTVWEGGFHYFGTRTTFENWGVFELRASQGEWFLGTDGVLPILNNRGTLTKSTGGSAGLGGYLTLNNSGLLDVQGGTLMLNVSGTNTGRFNTAAGALLLFSSGAPVLGDGATFTGAGVSRIGGSLTIAGNATNLGMVELNGGQIDGSGAFHIANGGTMNWSQGQMSGNGITAIDPGGRLVLNGNTSFSTSNARSIQNGGLISCVGGVTFPTGGARIENSGTIQVSNTLWITKPAAGPGPSPFINTGLLQLSPGPANQFQVAGSITNYGEVDIQDGRLTVGAQNTPNASYTQVGGVTRLNGGILSAGNPDTQIKILGGGLSGHGTVSLLFGGVLFSGGVIDLGASAGILNLPGAILTNTSVLKLKLGGLAPGVDHDQISLGSSPRLDGVLSVELTGGFMPALGDHFLILTCSFPKGGFTRFDGLNIGNGLRLAPHFTSQGLELVVNNAPRPDQVPLTLSRSSHLFAVEVDWPTEFRGFLLQTTTNLAAPDWAAVTMTWTNALLFDTRPMARYFRLVDP